MRRVLLALVAGSFLFGARWASGGEPPGMACARAKAAALARARAAGVVLARDLPADETASDTDVLHYRLDLEIDHTLERLAGSNTISVRAVKEGVDRMVLRLWQGFSATVQVDGRAVSPERRDSQTLVVPLGRAYAAGETFEVLVSFGGSPQTGGMGSITFTTHSSRPIISTLSEPWYAYTWWPVKEDNRDKATADLLFTVPSAMTVASNGALVEIDDVSGGRRRFHWRTDYPTAPYLFSFSATDYAMFEGTHDFEGGSMPVQFFIYREHDSPANRAAWLRSVDMLGVFSSLFGPYPFRTEKYGIYEFPFGGGMEHQTITGQGSFNEGLTAHELTHQWWGDMITCATWHDIWLNEGFATYGEALWYEFEGGTSNQAARAAAMSSLRPSRVDGSVYCFDITSVSRIFSWNFSYAKGGWVVHMLRGVLGDEKFFDLLETYRQRYEYDSVTTEQFQSVAEEIWGGDLDWFFQPWVYGIGAPAYRYGWRGHEIEGRHYVEVALQQVQSGSYATFAMPVELAVTTVEGASRQKVWNDSRRQHYLIPLASGASGVAIDPEQWILWTSNDAIAFPEGPPRVVSVSPLPGSRAVSSETAELRVVFHKPVVARTEHFALVGERRGPVALELTLAESGAVAVLAPAAPLLPDLYTLSVADEVVDVASGQRLDGEVGADGALPSGNGLPGGAASVRFTVERDLRRKVPAVR